MIKKPLRMILILVVLGYAWTNLATNTEKNKLVQSVHKQIQGVKILAHLVVSPYKRFAANTIGNYAPGLFSTPGPAQTPEETADIKKSVVALASAVGVDPFLALAVARVESNFNPRAVSSKGAIGVMQVMPATAKDFRVNRSQLFEADTNIKVGLLYLKMMLEKFSQRELAIAAYNCGPHNVIKADCQIPAFPETLAYVKKVTAYESRYEKQEAAVNRKI